MKLEIGRINGLMVSKNRADVLISACFLRWMVIFQKELRKKFVENSFVKIYNSIIKILERFGTFFSKY